MKIIKGKPPRRRVLTVSSSTDGRPMIWGVGEIDGHPTADVDRLRAVAVAAGLTATTFAVDDPGWLAGELAEDFGVDAQAMALAAALDLDTGLLQSLTKPGGKEDDND